MERRTELEKRVVEPGESPDFVLLCLSPSVISCQLSSSPNSPRPSVPHRSPPSACSHGTFTAAKQPSAPRHAAGRSDSPRHGSGHPVQYAPNPKALAPRHEHQHEPRNARNGMYGQENERWDHDEHGAWPQPGGVGARGEQEEREAAASIKDD